jgi:hypothetical protein
MPGWLTISNTTTGIITVTGYFVDGGPDSAIPDNPFGMEVDSPGVSITPPVLFTSGSAAWLQVLTDVINITQNGTYTMSGDSVVNYIDEGFPYGDDRGRAYVIPGHLPTSTNDSPAWLADNPPATEMDREFAGRMYYMWCSDVPGSIWVPLQVYNWGFEGEIDWSTYLQKWLFGHTYCNPSPVKAPTSLAIPSREPNWAGKSKLKK